MAYLDIDLKSDPPALTTPGLKSWHSPDVGLDFVRTTTGRHDLPERLGFAIPNEEDPVERFDPEIRISEEDSRRLWGLFWWQSFIHHRVDPRTILNLGDSANNAQVEFTAEIVSTSGTTLRCKGDTWNPRDIGFGEFVPNPEWPASGGRFLSVPHQFALPIGARCEFLKPSVLADKLMPAVMAISFPEDTEDSSEFEVTLSSAVDFATQPYDLFFPSANGKYYCRFFWYEFDPDATPNLQSNQWRHFQRRAKVYSSAVAAADPIEVAFDSNGAIVPDGVAAEALLRIRGFKAGDPPATIDPAGRVTVTQGTGSPGPTSPWVTTVDLRDIAENCDAFEIRCALTPNENLTGTSFVHPFGCRNDQLDASGSMAHRGGRFCAASLDASKFSTFRAGCWQPGDEETGCSRFAFKDRGTANVRNVPADWSEGGRLAALMYGSEFVLVQAAAAVSGPRAFHIERPAGACYGVASAFGTWTSPGVPAGLFASRTKYFGETFGEREVFEDEDGTNQRLHFGAFIRQGDWDAAASATAGTLASTISGWTSKTDARGETMAADLALYPASWFGNANNYTWAAGDSALHEEIRLVDGEHFAALCNPSIKVNAVSIAMTAIVAGT